MATINTRFSTFEKLTYSEEINHHPAWYGKLQNTETEEILKGHPPYTYLLRSSDLPHEFFLSFVQSDLSLEHRPLTQVDRDWFFQNGDVHRSSSYLNLIPEMMHCSFQQCRPLVKNSDLTSYF